MAWTLLIAGIVCAAFALIILWGSVPAPERKATMRPRRGGHR